MGGATIPQPVQTEGEAGFVGRARELAVLHAAFRDTLAGQPRPVLVCGDPGIGKTELVRVFARQARDQGALVLWGGAWEDGGTPPYWPWVQVLRGYRRQAGAAVDAALGGDRAVLGQLLPELDPPPDSGDAGEGTRFALFAACCAVLERAARAAPLVVVVDDLHAAGRSSALLLQFAAAERLPRVLLIAIYRTAEARLDEGVTDIIAALESAGTPLALTGLSPDEIAAMLPGAGTEVLAAVARRSGGNPLFVSQVARLLEHGADRVDDLPVPAGIRQAVGRQVARLGRTGHGDVGSEVGPVAGEPAKAPVTARQALAAAATLGGEVDPRLVAEVIGTPAEEVGRLLDAATQSGLLHAAPGGGYRFGHALIRETLYGDLTPQARAELHARVAAALERDPWRGHTSHAELAYHHLRSMSVSGTLAAKAVRYTRLAGEDALDALAYEEAAGHFEQALHALGRAPESTPTQRCELLLLLGTALSRTGWTPAAARVVDDTIRAARQAAQPRLLATAALLQGQYLDFNAPSEATVALLREAADALDPIEETLRARVLARLAIALNPQPAAARAAADEAVRIAREAAAGAGDADRRAAAGALAGALTARHHTRWGSEDPRAALASAEEIVAAAQRAREPDLELDGRVLRLTHLLETGDGPAAQRELLELDRLAELLRYPGARLVAVSRHATLATLTGDFPRAYQLAREAWQLGRAASLPDADAVHWGQLYGIWLHADLPDGDQRWMEDELRQLVARSHLSVAHAAALVRVEAAAGATSQAAGRLDDLLIHALAGLRPDMVHVWALTQLAQACRLLTMRHHARRLYQALASFAGRAAVAAGSVMCAGSTDFYLAGLAELAGDPDTADGHYRTAASCHRRLGAQPMLAHTLHQHALLLRRRGRHHDLEAASAAAVEAHGIATRSGMTKLLAALDQQQGMPGRFAMQRDGDLWRVTYAGEEVRLPDSLGLRYLDLLLRNPGHELPALDIVTLTASGAAAPRATDAADLPPVARTRGDELLDPQARAAYRRRLADLDEELAEAERWNDTERAARLRAEKDSLVHELAAAAGLGGRTRRLGSDVERARVNVTRAIRAAISRIRDRAPAAATHLDRTIATGSRCSYRPTR